MSFTSVTERQPSLAWQFENSNVDSVTNLQPSSQVSPGPAQLQGSAALVTNAPTSNTAVYFPGTTSTWMNLGTSTPVNFDTALSNIFFECWVYSSRAYNPNFITWHQGAVGGQENWSMFFGTDGSLTTSIWGDVAGTATQGGTGVGSAIPQNTWTHVGFAIANTASVYKTYIYVNGTPTAYTPPAGWVPKFYASGITQIGGRNNAPDLTNMYIRDLRVVQGGVVPTTSFAPGAAPFSYASPGYVASMNVACFTLLGQFVTYNPSGKYGASAIMRNLVTRYTWPFTPSINSGVTISFWIKFDNLACTISGGSGSSFGDRYYSFINGTPRFELVFVDNTFSYKGVTSSVVPSISTWYHVTYVFGNGSISQYINGSINGTRSDTPQTGLVFDTNLAFGGLAGSTTGTSKFELDDLRIYNTALTAAQVQSVYSSQGAPAPGPVMPQPQYAWDFNGTTTPYIGSATGTTTGSVSYNSGGKYVQSLIMNGSSYVKYSKTLGYNLGTGGATFAMWFKLLAVPTGNFWIFGASGTSYGDRIYILVGTTGYIGWTFIDNTLAGKVLNSPSALVVGAWTHLTFTLFNGTMTMYVNGAQVATRSDAPMSGVVLDTQFSIAALAGGSGENINAEYDDFRIFDRALTSIQVNDIYNQQGVPGRGVVQATPTYNAPLTGASNLNRIYGLQRLNTAYTGNIINIRRSTDNTNIDFTVDSTNTSLVTASGGQTLSSWLGVGTANVVIWYDQSGNGKNLTQLTNENQPGFSATTGLLYSTGLFMNFPDAMSITDASFMVGYIQRAYNATGSDQWFKQDPFVAGERGGSTNDYGLVIGGSGLFGFGTGNTDGPASTIATNGSGVYSFMTCTRNSTTGEVLLYNGTGSGTSFTKNTGALSGPSPTTMGRNTSGYTPTSLGADVSSFFMFDSVKTQPEIASIASRFVNSTFTASPVRLTGAPLFTQLSTSATSSAVGAFSLRAVNGVSTRAVQVRAQGQFPPAAMTSDGPQTLTGYSFGGSGSYVASASLDDVYIDYGFRAFDNNIGTWWHSNYPIYTSDTGIYNSGDARASITGGIYAGEWLQIKMTTPILLTSYSLVGRPGFETNRSPRKFWILGSNNDGANWSLVDTQTNINTWASPQVFKTFTISNPGTTYFNTFRIVVNEVGNLTTGASGQDSVQIASWNLVGSPPSADFYADERGNLLTAPVTGTTLQNWLGGATGYVTTWYDQSGRGNHAIQNTAANQPIIQRATKGPGYMVNFNGSSQFVTLSTSYDFLNQTNLTLNTVVLRTATKAGTNYVFGTNSASVIYQRIAIGFGSDTAVNPLGNMAGSTATELVIPAYTSSDPMYYITGTMTPSRAGYVNGSLTGTSTNQVLLSAPAGTTFSIGYGLSGGAWYYIGNIFELLIFTSALDQTQVTQIYQNQLGAYGT